MSSRRILWIGWATIAAFAALLVWNALARHPVGDYGAESDFYGGYAHGARLIQQGQWEPRRYVIVGPVFESALALAGFLAPDLFTAAKLLSVVSAVAVLCLWFVLLARQAGPAAGSLAVGFLATNPTFIRHAYAGTTDMLAVFMQAACAFTLLARPATGSALLAGVLGGLATLTRYSSIYLLVGGWWCCAASHGQPRERWGAMARFTAGFLAVVGSWCVFSATTGTWPGEMLARGYGFYAAPDEVGNVQDAFRTLDGPSPRNPDWREVVFGDPGGFVAGLLRGIPRHLESDAARLLGWPATAALVLGGWLLALSGRWRALAPVGVLGTCCFGVLLLAFPSPRYSLPMLLFYVAVAAGFAAPPPRRSTTGTRPISAAAWAAALAALVLSVGSAIRLQRDTLSQTPGEVIAAGRALARASQPGSRVISRKGHIGYYSGLEVEPFPRFHTLRELGAHARRSGADFLYYSWYETQLRPEFAYLLDTTSAVPGLRPIHASADHPAVLYRVGPEFGSPPAWLADPFQRSVHLARALVSVHGADADPAHHTVLALDALLTRAWERALRHTRAARAASPEDPLAWIFEGEALRQLGRYPEAGDAYRRALTLDPEDPAARIGLGRIELRSGRRQHAIQMWRAAASGTSNLNILNQVADLLRSEADSTGVREVRAAITRVTEERNHRRPAPRPNSSPAMGRPLAGGGGCSGSRRGSQRGLL